MRSVSAIASAQVYAWGVARAARGSTRDGATPALARTGPKAPVAACRQEETGLPSAAVVDRRAAPA
jgi:hypothetical protein